MKRKLFIGGAFSVALMLGIGIDSWSLNRTAVVHAAGVMAPRFELDPLWPKPLPNHWVTGSTSGFAGDEQGHIWIVHTSGGIGQLDLHATSEPPIAECCAPAPPVLEFDQEGNVIKSWGGPGEGYDWPDTPHGIFVDHKGNVWIGAHGKGVGGPFDPPSHDDMVVKFTNDGKFLMQIGKPMSSKGNTDTANLWRPAKIFIDPKANEAYVADGYTNRRVIVYDADSGKYKRMWGAYGNKPDDAEKGPFGPGGPPPMKGFNNEARDRTYNPNAPPAKQFGNPVHCVEVSNDNLVYVCDRPNDRIQVFKTDGTFVKEAFIERKTLGSGSVYDIAFSQDPQQKFLYVADGENDLIHILDRETLEELTRFGQGGLSPGEFIGLHCMGTDSKGNLYAADGFYSKRIQKFTYKGLAPVTRKDQGVVWPKMTH